MPHPESLSTVSTIPLTRRLLFSLALIGFTGCATAPIQTRPINAADRKWMDEAPSISIEVNEGLKFDSRTGQGNAGIGWGVAMTGGAVGALLYALIDYQASVNRSKGASEGPTLVEPAALVRDRLVNQLGSYALTSERESWVILRLKTTNWTHIGGRVNYAVTLDALNPAGRRRMTSSTCAISRELSVTGVNPQEQVAAILERVAQDQSGVADECTTLLLDAVFPNLKRRSSETIGAKQPGPDT